jgi:UDP-N-acetylmuramoyl-tripeptide--D-alanyl-D-alanine ligase
LYEYLRKVNGIAIYNDKDPVLVEKIFRLVNRAIPYSAPTGIELSFISEPTELNLAVAVKYQHHTHRIKTNLFGTYNIDNIKAAVAAGLFLGIDMKDIAEEIEKYNSGNNRSQIRVTKHNTLICDSYNANPSSMQVALESFSRIDAGKKMCILGDMLELGEKSEQEHIKVLKFLEEKKISNVLFAGPVFLKVTAKSGFRSFPDARKLKAYLASEPPEGFHILVKASRGIALEQIYDLL